MLVLMRRIGERLYIGDDIRVVVLGVNGKQVSLGIDGPQHIVVHGEEIYRRFLKQERDKGMK